MNVKRLLLLLSFLPLAASVCQARINLLELWHPGLDMAIGTPGSYTIRPSFESGDHFFEIPFEFDYITASNIEVGGRWGIKSNDGNSGIDDLVIGAKYVFCRETELSPSVLGEAAFSLPTGSFSNGLGTGSMDCLLHWAAQKKLSRFNGMFGLGIRLNSENNDKYTAGNVFFYHVGLSQPYKYQKRDTTLYCEIKGYNHQKSLYRGNQLNDDYQELYLAPGIDYPIDKYWKINAAVLIGMTTDSNKIGLLVSTKF